MTSVLMPIRLTIRTPNLPTPRAAEFGRQVARLTPTEGDVEMCGECAFREGTIPNQCSTTLVDAAMCAISGEPFLCHRNDDGSGRPGEACEGWIRWMSRSKPQ